jgi:hypothetical protein
MQGACCPSVKGGSMHTPDPLGSTPGVVLDLQRRNIRWQHMQSVSSLSQPATRGVLLNIKKFTDMTYHELGTGRREA